MFQLRSTLLATITLLTLSSIGGAPAADARGDEERYDVRIRRTSFGIPHIKAHDWGSLGYGSGYAFARDNLCALALDVLEARGELSRFFGPDGGNLDSDLFYTYWTTDEVAERFRAASRPDFQELVRGYAAGYNRYLRDTGKGALPEDCRDAEWVREIDEIDLYKVYHKLLGRAGAPNLLGAIVDAVPPPPLIASSGSESGAPAEASSILDVARHGTPAQLAAMRQAFEWKPEAVGSNMIAVGREATTDGRGRFWSIPTSPGRVRCASTSCT